MSTTVERAEGSYKGYVRVNGRVGRYISTAGSCPTASELLLPARV